MCNMIILTIEFTDPFWPFLFGQVDTQVINRHSRQCDGNSYEGVNGVAVQRHDHEEHTAQAVDEGKEQ